jgi:hypothetical protein
MMAGNVNNTDEAQLALVQEAFGAARQTTMVQNQHPVEVGTPRVAEARDSRPAAEMGLGFTEAAEGGVH